MAFHSMSSPVSVFANSKVTEKITINDHGIVMYDNKPLDVGRGNEKIPAKLDKLMQEGISRNLTLDNGKHESLFHNFLGSHITNIEAEKEIEYLGQVSYGGSIVGDFRVDGEQAFCIEHANATPPTGTPYHDPTPYNNAKIQRALYYGWNGPENIFGKDRGRGIVVTSLVLSRLYNGKNAGGENITGYSELWDKAQSGSVPNNKVVFSNHSLSVSVKNGKQVSQSTTFDSSNANSVKITVPSQITLVNESTGKKVTNGTMIVKGGQKVHLEAPLSLSKSYSTGNVTGSQDEYQPLVAIPDSGGFQNLAFGRIFKDPNNFDKFTATFVKRTSKITVSHVDNRTGQLLQRQTFTVVQGDKYSYSPLTNLKKGAYTYRPISTKSITGTVGNKDLTFTFYYDVPLVNVALKKLQIYTAPADDGLPVKLDLDKTNIYPNDTKGMIDAAININLYQGDNLVLSNAYTAQSLPSHIDMTIPSSSGLRVNDHQPYTVKIEGFNTNDVDVESVANTLQTDGYTSSEETFKLNVANNSNLDATRVIMTEVTPTTKEKDYNETFHYTFSKVPTMKTGYGYDNNISLVYTNELGQTLDVRSMVYSVPSQLIDSYLSYDVSGGEAHVPMNQFTQSSTKEDLTTTTVSYQLPHVNVEKETGYLFSDQEKVDQDSRITKPLIDGGNKFYLPLWMDLGSYSVESTSSDLGVNKINVTASDTLKVKAYMITTMDSPTEKDDEILMMPVNGDDPFPDGLPDGWTQNDVQWIESH